MPDIPPESPMLGLASYLPSLAALLLASGFFSGSEAAYFSLSISQRRSITKNAKKTNWAARLLKEPDRLLMGILFWNLAINIAYFSLVSRAAIALSASSQFTALVTLGSLLAIVVLGEFLPKSLAVMYPTAVAKWVALPLTLAIGCLRPFLPLIKFVNEASRRLLWPGLKPEPYLELADLDRAVELSTDDSELFEHERDVLRNIIRLSEIRAEEWMRPRTQFLTFKPPISLDALGGQSTPSGFMLITDKSGQDVVSSIDLSKLMPGHSPNLSELQKTVVVVPWCASIAVTLKKLSEASRQVAVIVNEFGDTIGVLTWDDILEAILQVDQAVSHRDLTRAEVQEVGGGVWLATGMTKLRRLERFIGRRIDTSGNLTVGGMIQETLRRLPEVGDTCIVDDLHLEIVQTAARGQVLVRLRDKKTLSAEEANE